MQWLHGALLWWDNDWGDPDPKTEAQVNTLFTDDYKSNGKELIIKVVWNQAISKSIFAFLSQAQPMPKHFLSDQDEEMTEAGVSLQDCLREFKQVETLDEDNMWYCNKCKEFV